MFTFAWPYFFLLLPLLWVVQRLFPTKKLNDDAMLRVPFISSLQTLNSASVMSYVPNTLQQVYAVCAWVFLLIACANPEWLGEPLPIQQAGRNIMLAVDVSPSMSIPDLQRDNNMINRLQSVKAVASGFIDKRHGDKIGLILFGSKAYLQTPLTFDRKTVSNMLDDATIGLAGDRTAIGDALGLAVKKFENENAKSRVLILLTDGGNNAGVIQPQEAVDLAKQYHIKIYTVGIGASELEISDGFSTQLINPSADLDEGLLKSLAAKTDGRYYRAEDQSALNAILEDINKLEPVSAENKTARPITALFYWPLAVAFMFISLLIFPTLTVKLRR